MGATIGRVALTTDRPGEAKHDRRRTEAKTLRFSPAIVANLDAGPASAVFCANLPHPLRPRRASAAARRFCFHEITRAG